MRTILALCFLVFLTPSAKAVEVPLVLNYTMTEANLQSGYFAVYVSENSQTVGITYATSFVFDVSVNTPPDRTSLTFSNTNVAYNSLPLSVSGVFDFGFQGEVPYTVEYQSIEFVLGDYSWPLALNGDFFGGVLGTLTVSGDVIVDGNSNPFSVVSNVFGIGLSGNLDTTNNSSIIMSVLVSGSSGSQIYSGTLLGNPVALDGGISIAATMQDNSNNAPEPGTLLLLSAGLVGLGVYGRKQER